MIFQFTENVCHVYGKSFETLYFAGGYHSIPDGCTVWGTSVDRTNRFIGDNMGNIVLCYSDGEIQKIPLIFGYTAMVQNDMERGVRSVQIGFCRVRIYGGSENLITALGSL